MSRELDAQCARALGHTVDEAGEVIERRQIDGPRIVFFNEDKSGYTMCPPVPAYSTDCVAVRLLEDEIERRGLTMRYLANLMVQIIPIKRRFMGKVEPMTIHCRDMWSLIRATPEQRARAFLAAMELPS